MQNFNFGLEYEYRLILSYQMYTLTYESVEAKRISSAEMEDLLEQARENNQKNKITGCLVYYNGRFIQILEGEREVVLNLYKKIQQDARHKEVHLFSDDDIEERTYPNWGMAYYPVDPNVFSKSELEQFRRNLLLLSDLSQSKSVTAHLFWKRIKMYLKKSSKNK